MLKYHSHVRHAVAAVASVALAVCLHAGAANAADPVEEARHALWAWEPLEIKRDGSTLFVRAKERRVTELIYSSMLRAGLCAFAGTGRIALAGIDEIVIVNRFVGQGWVFEGGQASCREVIEAPRGKPNIALLSRTSLF